jgi:hypothetical protein
MANKTTLKEIAEMLSHVVTSVGRIEEKMATKQDLATTEKRLDARIDGLTVKVEGIQRVVDAEAMQRTDLQLPRRVHELEEKVFGNSNHPKHLPL